MKLREAAEQALEALMEKGEHHQKVYRAAEALREALAPPQKEWVGLPEEKEILEMSKDAWGKALLNYGRDDHCSFYVAFARAIETYLKEKNT